MYLPAQINKALHSGGFLQSSPSPHSFQRQAVTGHTSSVHVGHIGVAATWAVGDLAAKV